MHNFMIRKDKDNFYTSNLVINSFKNKNKHKNKN